MTQAGRLSLLDVLDWDVGTWQSAFDFWLSETRIDLRGARVLEIGAGKGGLSLFLASEGADVVCTELSNLEAARAHHFNRSVSGSISYRTLNLATWPADLGTFEIIVQKSVLGALGHHPPVAYPSVINSIMTTLNPKGEYWFADNLAGSPFHRILRKLLVPWGSSWRYFTWSEHRNLFGPEVEVTARTYGLLAALGRTERQRMSLSRIERTLRLDRAVPERWRYVAAGIARLRTKAS